MQYVLAIDQGTTSSRAILFDKDMKIAGIAQQEFEQIFPKSGWVEHNPKDIWGSVINTCQKVMKQVDITASQIVSIGITNQRETSLIWDKHTGEPIYNAIVWQDRRTAEYCNALKVDGLETEITHKTGLLIDPYFSATKLRWLFDNVDGAYQKAQDGKLLFGTMDSYIIWKLSGGKSHVTDATNAARTMLYNIRDGHWDTEICQQLDIPMQILPEVKDCAADFGQCEATIFGHTIPIYGVAGDQQAASIGQACFERGMLKATYGTGCFALLNTGNQLVTSKNRLLGTIAYQLNGKTSYAIEGSIFNAGSVVQWLRDGLKIIDDASETGLLAEKANPEQKLVMVPAFTGLGAPYWDAECRGAIFGITRDSGPAEFARAALESVAYQTRDLLEAMVGDWGDNQVTNILRVDGGMSASNWTIQFLADIIDAPVDRPKILETTALGVAWLAGMYAGFYPDKSEFVKRWALDKRFEVEMDKTDADRFYAGWKEAVNRTLTHPQ